jgi:lysophospholipase
LRSPDGKVDLFVTRYLKSPMPEVPRLLFILHGQGEHGARYSHFPTLLEGAVDGVISMDHRGHGRSQGVRGHVDHFEQYVDDAFSVLLSVQEEFTAKASGRAPNIHLLGHSMGGLIGLLLLQEKSVTFLKSATISAPLLELNFPVPAAKRAAGKLLSGVLGGLQMDTGLDVANLSHDAAVVAAYRSDQLVHSKATARFFTEMLGAMARASSRDSGIYVPVQFIVPLEDRIVSARATIDFHARLQSHDKRISKYDGFFHESFNEIEKDRAFEDLRRWIRAHG